MSSQASKKAELQAPLPQGMPILLAPLSLQLLPPKLIADGSPPPLRGGAGSRSTYTPAAKIRDAPNTPKPAPIPLVFHNNAPPMQPSRISAADHPQPLGGLPPSSLSRQHRLYFLPLPQTQLSFRPILSLLDIGSLLKTNSNTSFLAPALF